MRAGCGGRNGTAERDRRNRWPPPLAARAKIAEVRKLVLWWDASVRESGNPQLSAKPDNSLSTAEAEAICQFAQPRISEWRTRLARDGYAGDDWLNAIIGRFRIKIGLDHAPVRRARPMRRAQRHGRAPPAQ